MAVSRKKHNLVIVESPAKVKTIKKFLGSNYEVAASNGHVRDLPKSKLGIDIEHDYEPQYITISGKGELLAGLRKQVKKADRIYLATDPDREGEAISWHLMAALKLDDVKDKQVSRITFNEITKNAVTQSLKNARELDMNLVDAQQTRRILDRMVGYEISPLLCEKVKRGLSAGRVQSAALKIICDREDLIDNFEPKTFFAISADLASDTSTPQKTKRTTFNAKLDKILGQHLMPVIDLPCDRIAFVCQGNQVIRTHGDIAILSELFHSDADGWLGNVQPYSDICGPCMALFFQQHENLFQIVFC